MTILIKIAVVSILYLLFSVMLKANRPEYVFLLRIFSISLIFYFALEYISKFIESYSTIFNAFNIESSHISLLIKIVGITLITDFISNTLKDSGEAAVANTVTVFSKFMILFLTMPILNGIIIFCLKFIDL